MPATHNNDGQKQPSTINNKISPCGNKKCQQYNIETTQDIISITSTDLLMKKNSAMYSLWNKLNNMHNMPKKTI